MKKQLFSLSAALLATVLFTFFACSKYKDSSIPTDITPQDQSVTASLQGRVLDENGLPVKDAAVTSGGATTTTDVNGVFTFSNISLSSRFGYVKVVKQGYFTGSRSILTNVGAQNYVSIHLLPRVSKGTFVAISGGNVTVQSGNTVTFDASSVVTASTNAPYTGNVNVYATYIDPTDDDLPNHVPGTLRGINSLGKEVALQTFGMIGVELEGDAGEKLQIAPGKKATLTMAITTNLQASAPDSIPLWYFNDSTGKWIEQGTGVRRGNSYVGQVGHFSFWNYDAPYGLVNFKVRLKDQQGNPLAYTYIKFTSPTFGPAGGYTDSSGFAQGLIPKGQMLLFQVISDCGTLLYGANIGPTLTDQDLGTPTVEVTHVGITFSGTVIDCSGNPVTNGFVNISFDGLNYRAAVANGSFTLPLTRCSVAQTQAQVTAGDFTTVQVGSTVTMDVVSGNVNTGQLSACGTNFDQFINLTYNGNTYSWTSPPDELVYRFASLKTYFYGYSGNRSVNIGFNSPLGTGTFPISAFHFYANGAVGPADNSLQSDITGYGPVNGYITGTLSGNVFDSVSNKVYPLTGSFKMMRTE